TSDPFENIERQEMRYAQGQEEIKPKGLELWDDLWHLGDKVLFSLPFQKNAETVLKADLNSEWYRIAFTILHQIKVYDFYCFLHNKVHLMTLALHCYDVFIKLRYYISSLSKGGVVISYNEVNFAMSSF